MSMVVRLDGLFSLRLFLTFLYIYFQSVSRFVIPNDFEISFYYRFCSIESLSLKAPPTFPIKDGLIRLFPSPTLMQPK